MKRVYRKLNSRSGMTLAETLLAVLILVLASSVVATGMPAAVNAYRNAIDAANAQVLLSTTVNALRGELSTARDVKVNGKTITYTSSKTENQTTISLETDSVTNVQEIMIQEYNDFVVSESPFLDETKVDILTTTDIQTMQNRKNQTKRSLLTESMTKTTKDGTPMAVYYSGVTPPNADGVMTISGLAVYRGTGSMAGPINLTIRVLTKGA